MTDGEFSDDDHRDFALIQRIRQGDADAFLALYEAALPLLVPFAFHLTHSRETAEDVVHGVFLAIWVNHEHWNPTVALRPYLYRAVRNAILKTVRHERVTREAATHADPNHPYGMGAPSPATDTAIESSDIVHTVASAIRQLPERQRTAVMLRWYDNMTTAAIAVVMGISRQAVEKLLHSAEARLGIVLARKMGL